MSAVREKSLLLTPVTLNVTWRPLLKLVPRVPAETLMAGLAEKSWIGFQFTGVMLAMRPPSR